VTAASPPSLLGIVVLVTILLAAVLLRAFEVNRYLLRKEIYALAFSERAVTAAAMVELYCGAYRMRRGAISPRTLNRLEKRCLAAVTDLLVDAEAVRRVPVSRLQALHAAASAVRAELLQMKAESRPRE
jgi:hypothetical protein